MQEEAVEYIAATISRLQNCNDGKRRLFLIQTYVIGKEHILIEVINIAITCFGQLPQFSILLAKDNQSALADYRLCLIATSSQFLY